MPLPIVNSDSNSVCRIAVMYLLTSRSSVMTSSWQGASFCETSTDLSGCVIASAIFRVRSWGVLYPNNLSTTFISASRFVMARTCGFPFTLLKSTTGPPSRCFCTPVISRSGSTSTSVLKTSPCVSNHSSAERSDVTSFPTSFLVSSANAVAIISLLLFYVEQTSVFLNAPQASQLASHALRERAFLRQFFILASRQTQPLDEHFFVVRSQTRRRTADAEIGRAHV